MLKYTYKIFVLEDYDSFGNILGYATYFTHSPGIDWKYRGFLSTSGFPAVS